KSVSMDTVPKSSKFNAERYDTIVAYPAPFHKYAEPFLCLVGMSQMDLLSFIRTADPTKVRIGERQCDEDELKLLVTTVWRVVSLLPVAPARSLGELEASVDKLFDEGGSGTQAEQGDFVGDEGGQGINIQPAAKTIDTVAEDEVLLQPGTLSADSISDKSRSVVQQLLAGAVQNAKVRGDPIPTLPFVTSSVSATPEREGEGQIDSVTRLNLRTISAPQRFVISLDSSHHFGANIAEAEVDSFVRPSVPVITAATTITPTTGLAMVVKEKIVKPSLFSAKSASARTDPTLGGFTDLSGSDFLVGGIRTVFSSDTDLQKVYVPQWGVANRYRLDDGCVCCKLVDEFAPLKFFTSIRGMKHDQLFTEFTVGAARQMSLSAEVRMHAEYNIKDKMRQACVVEERNQLLKSKDKEIENLKAQLLLKESEAADAIRLRAEASKFEAVKRSLQGEIREQEVADLNVVATSVKSHNDNLIKQDAQLKVVNDKFDKLYADFVEMALHLEERFYPHLLTTIAGCRWLLTYGMKLAIAKCLNSSEYLFSLGADIGKAIEKGMQNGLAARITHGKEGRVLADVATYNPSTEVDYVFALQQHQSVNFSLLTELKLNKDSSVETLMNILRLEETVAGSK
nr:hypothetical protein [Tanacetum cinerariifolium]